MTQPKLRTILLFTLLIFTITAAGVSSAQQTKVISPPEFGNQGKDDLPFSPGILVGDTLYVSGEIGFDLHTGQIPKDFDAEMKACLDDIGIVLKAAGMDYSDVVSAQVFLTDMSQFKRMNAVYASVFKMPRPARVTVGVAALAVPTAHVEIMVTARRQISKN
ncbi:MAG: RidA family protein [Terriglobales bacterium]|jgi:2-iminobutanoate/2-iminopropanoate deaminase